MAYADPLTLEPWTYGELEGDQDYKREDIFPSLATITLDDSMIPPAAIQALHASNAPRPYFLDPRKVALEDWLMLMTKRTLELPNWINTPPGSQQMSGFDSTMDTYELILSKYCTPNMRIRAGFPETNLIARDLNEHKANLRAFLKANPSYHVEVNNSTVELYQRGGRACVILSTRVSGLFGMDHTRESVNRMLWVRRNDRESCYWQMCELSSLRGPGPVMSDGI